MNYWLVKSEPETWSWDDQVAKKVEHWDGVRNHQAANNMKAMKVGDRAFFYHSGGERAIVGIVRVVKTYYPDPSDASGRFGMVDVEAVAPLKAPVTLAQIKAEPALARLALVRQSRLSVMPVDAESWKRICRLGGVRP
jgi:predicted RNA-binding protein with PUA-like domain